MAELTPTNLVVVFDTSASMGCDTDESSPNHCTTQWRLDNWSNRWVPVTDAFRDFFGGVEGQVAANGLNAAIIFFPASGTAAGTCSANYQTPNVYLTSLANPEPLLTALDLAVPAGGTPTLPALYGAHEYAEQRGIAEPNSRSVVIMVTDGQPFICADSSVGGPVGPETPCQTIPEHNYLECRPSGTTLLNTIDDIASVASAAAERADYPVSTYVIGIGTETGALSPIATAGGTDFVYLADGTEPSVTRETIKDTLEQIRLLTSNCDVALPSPPEGYDLEPDQVNLEVSLDEGLLQRIPKSTSCAGAGWRYDNEASPTLIELCPETCAQVQEQASQLRIMMGCPTVQAES